jgi:hypothetical protein
LARSLAGEPVGVLSKRHRKQKSRMRLAYNAMTKINATASPHDLQITIIEFAVRRSKP